MAIVFNNLSSGGGGSKLYRHLVKIKYSNGSSYNQNTISIITNFSEPLTNNNSKELLTNFYGEVDYKNLNIEVESYDDNSVTFYIAYFEKDAYGIQTKKMTLYFDGTSKKNNWLANSIISDTVTEL